MAEGRKKPKLSSYSLRKRTVDSEDKENCQSAIKTVQDCQCTQNCTHKNRIFAETTARNDNVESKKFKFPEVSAFRVYVDGENETELRNNHRDKRTNEKTKVEKDRVRNGIDLEKKDKLVKRVKVLGSKNDEQKIPKEKNIRSTTIQERIPANRAVKISKADVQAQRKDTKKLSSNVPTVTVTRRASCTESTGLEKCPVAPLKKAASITNLSGVSRQIDNLKPRLKKSSASKPILKTSSVNPITALQKRLLPANENFTRKLRSSDLQDNTKKLLEPPRKEVEPHTSNKLLVDLKRKSKSQEVLNTAEFDARENKPFGSSKTKLNVISRRVRFRSTDESAYKKAEPIVESKSNSKGNARGPLESAQKISDKDNGVSRNRIPSLSSEGRNDIYLQPCASSTAEQIITPEDGAPIPSPKKAKVERRKHEPDYKPSRQVKDPGCPPCELVCYLQYLEDTIETEWGRQKHSPKLSPDFFKKNINTEQRKIIVSFLLHVGYHCHYPSFILYQTVKLFDAAMDKISLDITNFQLAALACLWISLKKDENIWKVPMATTIITFAKDQYEGKTELLLQCERLILKELNFQIKFADPYTLSVYYLFHCKQYVPIDEDLTSKIYYSSGYMIDLSLLDEKFCYVPAMLLAITVAELLFCLFMDSEDDLARPRWLYWRSLIQRNHKNSERFCSETIDTLRAHLIRNTLHSSQKQSSYKTVYKKYRLNRYGKISEILVAKVMKLPCGQYIQL